MVMTASCFCTPESVRHETDLLQKFWSQTHRDDTPEELNAAFIAFYFDEYDQLSSDQCSRKSYPLLSVNNENASKKNPVQRVFTPLSSINNVCVR